MNTQTIINAAFAKFTLKGHHPVCNSIPTRAIYLLYYKISRLVMLNYFVI